MFAIFIIAIPFLGIPVLFITIALFSLMLIHELGHAFVAQRLGYKAYRITIYPIVGLCFSEPPYSAYEAALIAWGGVTAQFLLFVPATTILILFGNSSVGSVNVLLVAFSYINACMIVMNLLPFAPFDGKQAWQLPIILLRAKWTMYQLKRKKILK